jgi:hypothetical protein
MLLIARVYESLPYQPDPFSFIRLHNPAEIIPSAARSSRG